MNLPPPGICVDEACLGAWPLPMPPEEADKEERGRVLIVGGSREMPGAVILAATAALRAGAGKVAIATSSSAAPLVAMEIPESRVIGLPETQTGGLAAEGVEEIADLARRAGAVLIGPGMVDETATAAFVERLLPRLDNTPLLLDACAMGVVRQQDDLAFNTPVLMTPHAGEMAHLSGTAKAAVQEDPASAARAAAARWKAVVAVKGADTYIADAEGGLWHHAGGNVGLACSGSGDTLAGIIAGLVARGAPLTQACAWGVALHARAGERLAERKGPLGYLAREILDEIPLLMHSLAHQPGGGQPHYLGHW
ncbi:yjeF C-terminal region, hydroxyethylthiazole kinase-related [Gulbenkiania indica]|uniref:ADP-dependent (S)-NAD(P)H-hydrate dehydratase n=2 Tax=Gulbenkiania TaxID=397456 RepID=A0A0K6GW95_9NEIS|nr:NAD(P)H-hydrate dehydratase [Gulbenkiania indica]CUA82884.1 yjeF C-terminal region, hydroxyethylthiazole kinase-related [Gulbenkiania indica]